MTRLAAAAFLCAGLGCGSGTVPAVPGEGGVPTDAAAMDATVFDADGYDACSTCAQDGACGAPLPEPPSYCEVPSCGDGRMEMCERCELAGPLPTCMEMGYSDGARGVSCANCSELDVGGCGPPCVGPAVCLPPILGGDRAAALSVVGGHDQLAVAWARQDPTGESELRFRLYDAELAVVVDTCLERLRLTRRLGIAAVADGWLVFAQSDELGGGTLAIPLTLTGEHRGVDAVTGFGQFVSNPDGDALILSSAGRFIGPEGALGSPFDIVPWLPTAVAGVYIGGAFLVAAAAPFDAAVPGEIHFVRVHLDGVVSEATPTGATISDTRPAQLSLLKNGSDVLLVWVGEDSDGQRVVYARSFDPSTLAPTGARTESRPRRGVVDRFYAGTWDGSGVAVVGGFGSLIELELLDLSPVPDPPVTVTRPVGFQADVAVATAGSTTVVGWAEVLYPHRVGLARLER